ncbi:serine hydrolase domain-containing protein [Mucilaginibacter ginsenosidivorans]|uniref:Beta-lactamase family protein n=1 Tax=Mucilaginibacter ginsenosidivorans TaxID=398053 RepID=A0A5B8UY95_9SPHI|nr:serine hydrolase domain-containing protein [Mucilaginibacter ginsenosidivorans]QEC63675.1 beta-lactamase family protein [Mucilaginibacter ginsenosidivorans]
MIKIQIAVLLTLFSGLAASAQSVQQYKTDSVFNLVKKYFNAKQPDSIYAFAGEKFREALTPDAFRYVCTSQLFPLGQIKNSSLIAFVNNKDARYKLTFDSMALQLWMNLDDKGKIGLFLFQPYKEEAGNKPKPVATTNLMRNQTDKKVDSAVRPYIQKTNTVGLSIGILRNGAITTYNYGETKWGNNQLPGANTLFEIGSITKTFTATLLAYYANEGKVKLDDPITRYLPDSVSVNPELKGITLQMLSNHSSGLPRLPDNLDNHDLDPLNPYKDYEKQHLFTYLKTCKLAGKPGEKYAYSNLGVGLLGTILEQVSGKTFEQMVEELICKPLGMNSTAQHLTLALKQRFVAVYNENGKETPAWDFGILAPCGSLRSTVTDLLIYAKANMTAANTRLSKAFELTHKVTFDKDIKLGLGWHIINIGGAEYYFHNGGTYGCSSFLVFNPEGKLAVVVLSNSGASIDAVGGEIVKSLQ